MPIPDAEKVPIEFEFEVFNVKKSFSRIELEEDSALRKKLALGSVRSQKPPTNHPYTTANHT
jgi:hypothetical protein